MEELSKGPNQWLGKTIIISLLILILAMSFIISFLSINRSIVEVGPEKINILTNSNNDCVQCHKNASPGIVEQYGVSAMARASVKCQDCHEVAEDYPGAVEHEDTFVLQSPSTEMCNNCHTAQVAQFNQSRHSLPSYVAYNGTVGFSETQLAQYRSIPEGLYAPDKVGHSYLNWKARQSLNLPAKPAMISGNPARTVRLVNARNVTCGMSSAWNRYENLKLVMPAILDPTIHNGKFIRNLHTELRMPHLVTPGIGKPNPELWM